MAPIKFEERLKEKLEERSLTPSTESWSKLSERLDVQDKKSKKPLFWWLSIAAGLIIMIAVSVQFFNTDEANELLPQLVEEPIEASKGVKQLTKDDDQMLKVAEQPALQEEFSPLTKHDKKQIEEQVIEKTQPVKSQVAENSSVTSLLETSKEEQEAVSQRPEILDKVILETTVVAALDDLKSQKSSATEKEVDSLLKAASKALFKDKLEKKSSKIVNAEALLNSVEDGMGQSFRSKVFDALKGGYETVKTAVVQRNN